MSTGSSDVRQVVPANLLERFFTNPLKFQTFMLLAQLGIDDNGMHKYSILPLIKDKRKDS
ncbi:hypothetical protein X777_10954 [Ooceraea biroi]|uniref:Uncharacterized protein n=1 Tax=Ooceraea biroi TaxID=2015173 RepID=A0A026W3N1_OOCBI|nr:hypothetical protein X777_10954 [Ooceraea biroi]